MAVLIESLAALEKEESSSDDESSEEDEAPQRPVARMDQVKFVAIAKEESSSDDNSDRICKSYVFISVS